MKDLSGFVDDQFESAPWIHACFWAPIGGMGSGDDSNVGHLRQLPCAKDKLFTVRYLLMLLTNS